MYQFWLELEISLKVLEHVQLNMFSVIDTDLYARCGQEKTEYSICMLKAMLG